MQSALHDLRFATRTLRRRPAFTVLAVATLALGIGAATTIYSIVNGVLLEPLPYRDSGRLVAVFRTFPRWRDVEGLSARWDNVWFSYPAFRDWQARQTSFESVGAWSSASRTLLGLDVAEQVSVVRATASLTRTLGLEPALGRFFAAGEDSPPGAATALISHEMWTTRFGSSPGVLGRSIRLDDRSYEIVGVLPDGVDLGNRGRPDPIWIPAGGSPSDARVGSTDYFVVARIRRDVSMRLASDETQRLVAESSPPDPVGARLTVWQEAVTRTARRPLLLLLGASVLLLALACVNVATLMLGETTGRTSEFATRLALGAGRARITRQMLVESLVIAAGGVGLGVLVARVGTRLLVAVAPGNVPRLVQVHVDGRVLIAASLAGAVTALLFTLAPVGWLMAVSPLGALGSGAGRATARHERWTLRTLVASQVALSCLLLIGAALLGRSVQRLSAEDPGFASERLVLIGLGTTGRPSSGDAIASFYGDVATRIAAIPGIERAAVGSAIPFSGGGSSSAFAIEGRVLPAGVNGIDARRSHVLPGFLETLGVRLLAGRLIDDRDRAGAPLVAVINETMARRFWPGESGIGKRIGFGDTWLTIVGVVGDVKHASLGDTTRVTVYLPARQQPTPYLTILARTRVAAPGLAGSIRQAVALLDPAVPVTRVETMPDLVSRSFAAERFRALLIGLFATVAGVLAVIGIYGVTARAVARQQREIGIRLALGARAARVAGLFVGRAAVGVTLGAAIGVAAALVASRFLAPYLFATAPSEPSLYAASVAVLASAALAGAWLPARHASRTNPASVLRER